MVCQSRDSLHFVAREACFARAGRDSRWLTNNRRRIWRKMLMVVQAGKKPTTKKIYFLRTLRFVTPRPPQQFWQLKGTRYAYPAHPFSLFLTLFPRNYTDIRTPVPLVSNNNGFGVLPGTLLSVSVSVCLSLSLSRARAIVCVCVILCSTFKNKCNFYNYDSL